MFFSRRPLANQGFLNGLVSWAKSETMAFKQENSG
jgi:hypothetical protein